MLISIKLPEQTPDTTKAEKPHFLCDITKSPFMQPETHISPQDINCSGFIRANQSFLDLKVNLFIIKISFYKMEKPLFERKREDET